MWKVEDDDGDNNDQGDTTTPRSNVGDDSEDGNGRTKRCEAVGACALEGKEAADGVSIVESVRRLSGLPRAQGESQTQTDRVSQPPRLPGWAEPHSRAHRLAHSRRRAGPASLGVSRDTGTQPL